MLTYLALGATYGFAAGAQPGQLQAYLISRALAGGWRTALPGAFAPVFSDLPIIGLVLLVLTRVPGMVVNGLRTAGGLFLIYLALRAVQAYRRTSGVAEPAPAATFVNAVFVNFLNPNPYLGWTLVTGPLLIEGWRRAPMYGLALVGAFYFAMIAVNAAIVVVFSSARSLGPRVAHVLVGLSVLALAAFGMYQLWVGGTALISFR